MTRAGANRYRGPAILAPDHPHIRFVVGLACLILLIVAPVLIASVVA